MEVCEFVGQTGGYGWLVFFFLVVVDGVGMCLLGGEGECEFAWLRVIYWKKKRIFKWSGKKYRIFDVWCIVIWGVKINKVVFWDAKC